MFQRFYVASAALLLSDVSFSLGQLFIFSLTSFLPHSAPRVRTCDLDDIVSPVDDTPRKCPGGVPGSQGGMCQPGVQVWLFGLFWQRDFLPVRMLGVDGQPFLASLGLS